MGPKPASCFCGQPAKYRCSACPVRYCSVACYKTHKGKEAAAPSLDPSSSSRSADADAPKGSAAEDTKRSTKEGGDGTAVEASGKGSATDKRPKEQEDVPLKRLTELKWPPEPDESIFTDPLKREDPKPLRHSELERIATSRPLRHLLANPTLRRVLTALDSFQSPKSRHAALARLLGVDAQSLAKPAASALMDRNSPPPLEKLLSGEIGQEQEAERDDDWGAAGWWLGYGDKRVWVGPEERRLMRAWAGAVTEAIGGWGLEGSLAWEV